MGDPVAGVMITLAPEIAAPEGSVICPRRTPEGVCATNALSDSKNKNATAKKRMYSQPSLSCHFSQVEELRRIAGPAGAINNRAPAVCVKAYPDTSGAVLFEARAMGLRLRRECPPNSREPASSPGFRWAPRESVRH